MSSRGARSGRRPHDEAGPAAHTDPRVLARGLAALRIFVGLIAFSNGLAKLLSFREIDVGPYLGTLVDRPESRGILATEAGRNDLPLIPSIVEDFVLPNYDVMQRLVTFTELGTGALLRRSLLARRRPDRLPPVLRPPAPVLLQRTLRLRATSWMGPATDTRPRDSRTRVGTRRTPRPQPAAHAPAILTR